MPATAIAGEDDDRRDEDLMLAYAAGDAAAFDALYRRHKGGVYRYLVRQCANAATADELFQDVWMNVIRVRESYAPTAKFATWLYRIAGNRLIDHWRASGHGARARGDGNDIIHSADGRDGVVASLVASADGDDRDEDPLASIPGPRTHEPDRRAESGEIARRLRNALASLPAAQRMAFLLHQEGGLGLAEIGAVTDAGVETVKSRLRYAVARLRAELGDLR